MRLEPDTILPPRQCIYSWEDALRQHLQNPHQARPRLPKYVAYMTDHILCQIKFTWPSDQFLVMKELASASASKDKRIGNRLLFAFLAALMSPATASASWEIISQSRRQDHLFSGWIVTLEVVYIQNSRPLLQCNKSQFIWAAPSSLGQCQNRKLTNTAHHVPPADQQ